MLNETLQVSKLSDAYRRTRRLRIDDIFKPEEAERIYHCLAAETPWGLIYLDGATVIRQSAQELKAMSLEERRAMSAVALKQAQSQYQFVYNAYLILENYLAGQDAQLHLHRVFEYINSPPVLDLVRRVTGEPTIVKADAQATLYAPGHFLKKHNDFEPEKGRRVAYVLGFTKGWQPDFGGLLHFLDANENVTDTFCPRFNTLTLFTVPQDHFVSCVSPYAPLGRLAITGWFRDR